MPNERDLPRLNRIRDRAWELHGNGLSFEKALHEAAIEDGFEDFGDAFWELDFGCRGERPSTLTPEQQVECFVMREEAIATLAAQDQADEESSND